MVNKQSILDHIILELTRELETLIVSANSAKDDATNPESKAENKYDTRGLEASYLAGAQAKRAGEVERILETLKKTIPKKFNTDTPIEGTALIKTLINDKEEKWFFFLPNLGGLKILLEGLNINTISPESPIGRLIVEKKVGDAFELKIAGNQNSYEIIDIF